MASLILEQLSDTLSTDLSAQRWTVITVQLGILAADIYLFSRGAVTPYLILSFLFILSLVLLQIVSTRFLWINPLNVVFQMRTPRFDTWILRVFLLLSTLFLALSLGTAYAGWNPLIPKIPAVWLVRSAFLLLLFLPLSWLLYGRHAVRNSIIRAIRARNFELKEKCPKGLQPRTRTARLVSDHLVEITFECDECGDEGYRFSITRPFRIP